MTDSRRLGERPAPKRNALVWAQEFAEALEAQTGVKVDVETMERLASWHPRLRERLPSSVVKNLVASSAAAEFSVADWVKLAGRSPVLLVVKKETLRRRVPFLAKLMHLSSAEAKMRIRRCPMLLCRSEKMTARNMAGLRKAIGLNERDWRRCLARFPEVVTYAVASLQKRTKGQRKLLDLTQAEYRKLILREPRLLGRSVTAITSMLKGMTELWGIERSNAQRLIIRSPNLLTAGPVENLDRNLTKLAKGFAVEKERVVAAFALFPPLAYQKPERLIATVEQRAADFGIGPDVLAGGLLRAPSLLVRRPEGWRPRVRLIVRIGRALGAMLTAKEILETFPSALTYSRERLLQRLVIARLGLWNWNWTALLTLRDEAAKKKLAAYFSAHPDMNALRAALMRRDLI